MFPVGYNPPGYFPPGYYPETGSAPEPPPAPSRQRRVFGTSYRLWNNRPFPKTYLVWDMWQAVGLNKLLSTPDGVVSSTTPVGMAYRGIPSRAERSPTGGAYQGAEVIWRLPADLLGGVIPLPADTITDPDNTTYAVQWVHYAQLTQEYRCFTIDLSVYLPDSLTVERPSYVSDAFKLDTPAFAPVYSNVPCRVQPSSAAQVFEAGSSNLKQDFDVTVAQELALGPTDRAVWNGDYYNIQSYARALRITDFPNLTMRSSN